MIDFQSGFMDKTASNSKVNRLINQEYDQKTTRARCLVLIEQVIYLHEYGAIIPVQRDPTFRQSQSTKAYRGKGTAGEEEGWLKSTNVPKAARMMRNLNFSNRIDKVCSTVRHSKACATDILGGGEGLKCVLYAPDVVRNTKTKQMRANIKKGATLKVETESNKRKKAEQDRPVTQFTFTACHTFLESKKQENFSATSIEA